MTKPKAVMNWSGGKDSALALNRILAAGDLDVTCLLTSVNSQWQRISMHGVRRDLLHKQAEMIGIELVEILVPEMPSMEVYEEELNKAVDQLTKRGITHSIFGDIFLEDLREYRETQLKKKGLTGVFPLWKLATPELMSELLALDFKASVACIDAAKLDKSFCGRTLDDTFVRDLPDDVDVCGENGEYHTFVYNAPFFTNPIKIERGDTVYRSYATCDSKVSNEFFFCDLIAI